MKMMNKFCALMLSVALCAGMAAPAFAYGGEPTEEVEQPVLTSITDEEDALLKKGSVQHLKVGRSYRIPKAHLLTYLIGFAPGHTIRA